MLPARALLLPLLAFSTLAQSPNLPPAARDLAQKLVNAYFNWGPKMNSAGAALTVREKAREGPVIVYNLYATGLPVMRTYSLVEYPVTQREPVTGLRGVTLNADGLAICAGHPGTCGVPVKPNDPIDFRITPALGEPFRLGLVSDDEQVRAFVKVVPKPNFGEDRGCRLEAVLLMPHAELFVLEATRFPPNAKLKITGDSEGEIQRSEPTTDANGAYASAFLPAKAGLKNGTVHVKAQAPQCSPTVSVSWGAR